MNFIADEALKKQLAKHKETRHPKALPKALIKYPADYLSLLDDVDNQLYKLHPNHTKEQIAALYDMPPIVDHPVLDNMVKPGKHGQYHIGKEEN